MLVEEDLVNDLMLIHCFEIMSISYECFPFHRFQFKRLSYQLFFVDEGWVLNPVLSHDIYQ